MMLFISRCQLFEPLKTADNVLSAKSANLFLLGLILILAEGQKLIGLND